jgi:hypothetical protein
MQCERIRKLISRWHRDELGAERKAARRKCSKALALILDIIRKNAVHTSLKGGGRFTGMPRMTIHLRYLTLKLRALCWVLRRLRAGRLSWCNNVSPQTHMENSGPRLLAKFWTGAAAYIVTHCNHWLAYGNRTHVCALHWRPDLWRRCAY